MKLHTLDIAEVLFIHSAVIDETGGSHGLRDLGLLESAVRKIEQTFGGQDLYPGLFEKAAALCLGIIKNHPFVDGNKRTAISAMGVFLALNGVTLKAEQDELALWAEQCAKGRPEIKIVAAWISEHAIKRS